MLLKTPKSEDLLLLEDLLKKNNMIYEDCIHHLDNFLVIFDKDKIVASAAYESCKEYAYFRSFSVDENYRKLGLANKLYEELKLKAIKNNIKELYLLTQTASLYFEKLGFNIIDKNKAPHEIKNTKQFSLLCPDSCKLMKLVL